MSTFSSAFIMDIEVVSRGAMCAAASLGFLYMMTQNYTRVPKIQSQSTSFQTFFQGWTPDPSLIVSLLLILWSIPTYKKYLPIPMMDFLGDEFIYSYSVVLVNSNYN